MKVTIDIHDDLIRELLFVTGERTGSSAVAAALDGFLENRRRQIFLDRVGEGKADFESTNNEVEDLAKLD